MMVSWTLTLTINPNPTHPTHIVNHSLALILVSEHSLTITSVSELQQGTCVPGYTFDTLALCKILRIPYTHRITNAEVMAVSGCPPLSNIVTEQCLRYFCHTTCSAFDEDHHRAVAAADSQASIRPPGRPNHTWLRAILIRSETTEHWSILCTEAGRLLRTLAFICQWTFHWP